MYINYKNNQVQYVNKIHTYTYLKLKSDIYNLTQF